MLIFTLFITALLLLATLIIRYQLATHNAHTDSPEKIREARNNLKRVHTWWLICGICIPALYAGQWAITSLVSGLVYWAAYEISKLLKLTINILNILAFTLAFFAYSVLIAHPANNFTLLYLLPVLTLFTLFVMYYNYPDGLKNSPSSQHFSITLLVLILCATSLLSIELIRQQSEIMGYDAGLVILFLFFMTSSNDIFQYLVGKNLGRTPLATNLSRHKTVEGALGGVLLTTGLGALTMPFIINISWPTAALSGAVISISGIAGDLNISCLKRQIGVKDAGNGLPGHGGLLDRIDSLLLSAPGFGLCLSLIAFNNFLEI